MEKSMDLIWGCDAIAEIIGRTSRQTFYLLERGELPAKKIGGRWVVERAALLSHFRTSEAA